MLERRTSESPLPRVLPHELQPMGSGGPAARTVCLINLLSVCGIYSGVWAGGNKLKEIADEMVTKLPRRARGGGDRCATRPIRFQPPGGSHNRARPQSGYHRPLRLCELQRQSATKNNSLEGHPDSQR